MTSAGATAATAVEDLYCFVIQYIWIPILQVVLRIAPMLCVRGFLWWFNLIFYGGAWVLWWTRYLASRWKYLSVSGRSIRDILCDPAGKSSNCERRFVRVDGILRDTWLTIRLRERQIHDEFLDFHQEWCDTVRKITATQTRIIKIFTVWAGEYEELRDMAFWIYASLIFCAT